jgi:Zeta toxin
MQSTKIMKLDAEKLWREFRRVLMEDVDATLDRMRDKKDKHGKIVLNSDDLFNMLPRYANNPAERILLGPVLYPVAARFTDYVFKRLLSRRAQGGDTVVFTAGGSATGKSTILRAVARKPGVDFIVDTTFSNTKRALGQVKKALAAKRKVEIHYVYRDFEESIKGMVRRALDPASGRIVPIDDMARTHFGVQRAVLEAVAKYQENEKVSIKLKVNKGGKLKDIDEAEFYELLHVSIDNLRERGQNLLDELYKKQRRGRGDSDNDRNARGKKIHVSQALYEAARSKTQARRPSPGQVDA